MEAYTVNDLIRFSDYFKKVLLSLYGDEAKAIYAYYEKRVQTSFVSPRIAVSHPTAFKLYCGITKLESIIFTQEDVLLFDVLYNGEAYEIKKISKNAYAEEKDFFYESQGLKDNGWMVPKSELYITTNAVNFLYAHKSDTLINHHLFSSEFLKKVEDVYQAIVRKGYKVTPETTVKRFYKDIVGPLYPNMSESLKIVFCKIFKGDAPL